MHHGGGVVEGIHHGGTERHGEEKQRRKGAERFAGRSRSLSPLPLSLFPIPFLMILVPWWFPSCLPLLLFLSVSLRASVVDFIPQLHHGGTHLANRHQPQHRAEHPAWEERLALAQGDRADLNGEFVQ